MTRKQMETTADRMARLVQAALVNEDPRGDEGNEGGVDPQRKRAADIARRWLGSELEKCRAASYEVAVDSLDREFVAFCRDAGPAPDSDEMAWWRRLAAAEIRTAGGVR